MHLRASFVSSKFAVCGGIQGGADACLKCLQVGIETVPDGRAPSLWILLSLGARRPRSGREPSGGQVRPRGVCPRTAGCALEPVASGSPWGCSKMPAGSRPGSRHGRIKGHLSSCGRSLCPSHTPTPQHHGLARSPRPACRLPGAGVHVEQAADSAPLSSAVTETARLGCGQNAVWRPTVWNKVRVRGTHLRPRVSPGCRTLGWEK